jgi:hypothetical protein
LPDALLGREGLLALTVEASAGDWRAGDQVWLRRLEAAEIGRGLNRDVLAPRPGGRFAFGRMIDHRDGRVALLPPGPGQRQLVIDRPAWVAVAEVLVRPFKRATRRYPPLSRSFLSGLACLFSQAQHFQATICGMTLRLLSLSTLYPASVRPGFGRFVARQMEALAARPDWDVTVINPIGLPPLPAALMPHSYDRCVPSR